jgi:hypothetical protein
MNVNMVGIIKRIIAEQGEAILGDPARLKGFVADYAKDEPRAERLAFGRCIEYGAYRALKNAADRAAAKRTFARKVRDGAGIDITLCEDALDALEAALFGAVPGKRSPQAVYAPPPGYQPQGQASPAAPQYRQAQPAYSAPVYQQTPFSGDNSAAPKSKKKAAAAAVVLIVIAALAYWGASSGKFGVANGWRGFQDFDSFSRAADMDEFLGEKITEDEFMLIMTLGGLFTDTMTMDIVSADKLTQRYEVPPSLRDAYKYLVRRSQTSGSTVYLAYTDGSRWYVISLTIK